MPHRASRSARCCGLATPRSTYTRPSIDASGRLARYTPERDEAHAVALVRDEEAPAEVVAGAWIVRVGDHDHRPRSGQHVAAEAAVRAVQNAPEHARRRRAPSFIVEPHDPELALARLAFLRAVAEIAISTGGRAGSPRACTSRSPA